MKKKQWPSPRIRIRGRWWRIVVKQLAPVRHGKRWLPMHGLCCYLTRTILLNPQFDMKATLLHEISHACQPDLDEDTVEEVEAALVNGLAAIDKIYGIKAK